jgi:hypothetical protein
MAMAKKKPEPTPAGGFPTSTDAGIYPFIPSFTASGSFLVGNTGLVQAHSSLDKAGRAKINKYQVLSSIIKYYKEAIAAEYATAFISTALKEVRDALGNAGGKSQSPVKKEELEELAARATEIRKEYAADMVNMYAKLQSVNNITAEIMNLERAMSASLPADLQGNLQFQMSQGG